MFAKFMQNHTWGASGSHTDLRATSPSTFSAQLVSSGYTADPDTHEFANIYSAANLTQQEGGGDVAAITVTPDGGTVDAGANKVRWSFTPEPMNFLNLANGTIVRGVGVKKVVTTDADSPVVTFNTFPSDINVGTAGLNLDVSWNATEKAISLTYS